MASGRTRRAWFIVAVLLASMAGALWFAGRASALLWLAAYAVSHSDGRLELQGVQGSLYGPVQIATLVFETNERRVELRGLELDWSVRNIVLHKQVQVQALRIQELRLTLKKLSTEPLLFPHTLRFPLEVGLLPATVERMVIEVGGRQYEFSQLTMALENPADKYHITAALDTPWGKSSMTLDVGAISPYPLNGQLRLDQAELPYPHELDIALAGNLAEIKLVATGSLGVAQATANATLMPFDAVPLQQVTLHAQSINPQQFGVSFPQADFDVEVSLQALSPNVFQGELEMVNATPGTVDSSRIPVKKVQAAFGGALDKLTLSTILLDLGEAGKLEGTGGLQQGQLNLDLTTTDLNLRGVHSNLNPTRLAGKVHLGMEGEAQVMRAELEQEQYRIQLDAIHRDSAIEVTSARIESGDSALELQGALQLTPQREFHAAGMLRKFDPARFGDYPTAAINGRFSADGKLLPALQATVQVAITDSHYRNRPLSGKGSATVSLQRLWDADMELRLGADRLIAQGGFGASGDTLSWRLSAADIGAWIGPRFGGRITASGTLTGSVEQPAGVVEITAENLRWEQTHQLARVTAHGQLKQGLDGPLMLKAELQGYRATGLEVEQVLINAQGRRSGHEIVFSARNKVMDMRATLKGGWHEASGWVGEMTALQNRGRYPVALKSAAKLMLSQRTFSLTGAALTAAGGEIHIATLARSDGRLSSQGVLEGVRVAELLKLVQQPLRVQTTLVLGGKWALQATDKMNGEISLWRDEGDMTVLTEPHTALGLTRMVLSASVKDNQLATTVELAGTALGAVTARIHSSLARRDETWGISGDAALLMDADVNMPSIAWLTPLLGQQMAIDGAVKVRMSAQGTVNNPNPVGELRVDGFKFDHPQYGISFTQGSLRASVDSSNLLAGRFELQGGAGSVSGDASLGWVTGEPEFKVALTANKLELLSRPDRLLILTGKSEARVHAGTASVTAKLKADQGLIELPEEGAPSQSEDVVVLGRPVTEVSTKTPYALLGDLDIDLGDQFYLKGKGVDARLVGAVKIHLNGQTGPTASGNIRVAKGSYFAYGQSLSIERGILNFSGPMDNPGLNIVALRKNLPVEAGVAISGTALTPQVRLTSTPSVPDSEKLSWLVLGHGLEKTSGGEFSVLQAAAGALLAQGESVSLETKIAHAAGLDEFSLAGAGGVESTVLTLGKRLSSRAYLTFEQGLAGASNLAKINYSLTERLSVRTHAGTEGAVDLFYTFRFD